MLLQHQLVKRLTVGVAALGVLAGLCACGPVSNESKKADGSSDKAESLTVVCGAMEDLCQAWTKAFTEKTGIQTSFVRLSSGETVARLEAAKDKPEFDVWHGGPVDGYGAAAEKGLVASYDSPSAKVIPDKYKDTKDHNWTGVYVGVLGFCSNKTVLQELGVDVPKKWDDLLNPKLKGQVSTAHPSTSGTAFTTLWTQHVLRGGDDQALEWMKKLNNNVLQYSKSGTAPGQIAGRGEVAVGLVFSHDCVKYQDEGMKDLVVSFPEDGTGYEIGGVGLVANTPHEKAAKQYIDWAISAEAQNIGQTVGSNQVLTNPDAKPNEKMAKLDDIKLVDYDFVASAKAKSGLTARFDEEVAGKPKE
ncbi:iron(III) transport system substrate-binding protein [Mobiluncus mulieris]|uniref:2-aminoethylphosphonate ABC transporter substrate-binding protein n=1 Tax=Mobiluncus mulieris TaxID=2052 RepID=A0A8G2HTJ6_9ACTO|nr:ABC transporter substrate-binding protein [Mobiluncus mulieris]MBB5846847.1 iron(III) transport system substrate-binding protein [Mobiluncus mulieris]STO16688.1 2-aminoethylphosphonate ABC transporter substrate-binding protein [Mobiluncus mulieris]